MKETKNFENALKKLENITRKLENEDISLDESIELFEEGVKLVRFLQTKLNEVERKVEILIKETEEKFKLEDYKEDIEEDIEEV
ncbi:MAG: exodeoxyribonuclease VII small subunit [Proteobacteria bacterium]|nr:exodeoxyribonuclease VII small subunit [Pseudomonadota bacterium]